MILLAHEWRLFQDRFGPHVNKVQTCFYNNVIAVEPTELYNILHETAQIIARTFKLSLNYSYSERSVNMSS